MSARKALASQLAKANPVAELGHEFRHVQWPKLPGKPPRTDGTVVIPGPRRSGGIPARKV
jgi:hypothetical protein